MSFIVLAWLLAICLVTFAWNANRQPRRVLVGVLALLAIVGLLLVAPALAGGVNYHYKAEMQQTVTAPPIVAPPVTTQAVVVPQTYAYYVPAPAVQVSTLAMLPVQATYVDLGVGATRTRTRTVTKTDSGPTLRQRIKAKRLTRKAITAVPVGPVPTVAVPAPIECEGLEAD